MSIINVDDIIGKGIFTPEYVKKLGKIAKSNSPVLITGETGTGKGVLARLIAQLSNRNKNKFVHVNCGAVTETLLESLLFGSKKGAYTGADKDQIGYFQEAEGGTIFLDEITETSLSFQTNLLKILDDGTIKIVGDSKDTKVNVRIIFATNKDIPKMIEEKTFKDDLYFRINVFSLYMPPLRERKSEIHGLVEFFMKKFSQKMNKTVIYISPECLNFLQNQYWKGNIRELSNAMEHAVTFTDENMIQMMHLPPKLLSAGSKLPIISHEDDDDNNFIKNDLGKFISLENCLTCNEMNKLVEQEYVLVRETIDRLYFKSLFIKTRGNISEISRISKIKRRTLYVKLNKLKFDIPIFRKNDNKTCL